MTFDDHDPLCTASNGPLPAFDQPAGRANRIPRIAPPRRGLFRRLHNRLKARYLGWQLRSMRTQMDRLEARLNEAADTAIGMALMHMHSRRLQAHRCAMRQEHLALFREWQTVQAELDALEALQ